MKKSVYKFISQQNKDPIIERRTCRRTGEEFPIFQGDVELLDKLSPTIGGKKFPLPLPTLCPRARQIQRMCFRNERKFYRNTSSISGEPFVSVYHPESPYKNCTTDEFYECDGTQWGREYSGDFMQDQHALMKEVPLLGRYIRNMDNSEYCNLETDEKDCYQTVGGHDNIGCMYSTYSIQSHRVVDSYFILQSRNCYQCIQVFTSQNIFFAQYIENCFDVRFSRSVEGSQHILFGYGLVNKQYVYKNNILPKEEWEQIFLQYQEKIQTQKGLQEVLQEYEEFMLQQPESSIRHQNCEDTIGTDLVKTKGCFLDTMGEDGEDNRYCHIYAWKKDSMDSESCGYGQLIYNTIASYKVHGCIASSFVLDNVRNVYHSHYLINTEFSLGSVGLKNKQYTILNKQYSQEERTLLAQRIAQDMIDNGTRGSFLPPSQSPFPYNDTVAMDRYPVHTVVHYDGTEQIINLHGQGTVYVLSDKELSVAELDLGGSEKIKILWRTDEHEVTVPAGLEVVNSRVVERNDRGILQKAFRCEQTGKPFRIVGAELDFYLTHHLPLPVLHPDVRHAQRLRKTGGRELYLRTCDKTGETILSTYPQEAPEIVYSQEVYMNEIYG